MEPQLPALTMSDTPLLITKPEEKEAANTSEYAKALAAGKGAFGCLPVELRQCIFEFAASHHVQDDLYNGLVEASRVSQRVHDWLPPLCHVNDDFFLEGLPMFLRQVNIVVRESYGAFSLYYYLQSTVMLSYVYSLRFIDAWMLAPSFAGSQLLEKCINLRHVWLTFKIEEFPSIHRYEETETSTTLPFVLDRKSFLESYSFRQLLVLKKIEKVTIFIAITKRSPRIPTREDQLTCWGIVPWLKKKFSRRSLAVEINCMMGYDHMLDRKVVVRRS